MSLKIMLMASCLMITACSTQSIRPVVNTDDDSAVSVAKVQNKYDTLTRVKAGKELKLVRMMEGGACNKYQQGAVGLFGLYANPDDIDRIKLLQGPGIFTDFQSQIETFSMRALQQTVDSLNFQNDIHAQNKKEKDTRQQLADSFSALFADHIAEDITEFEAKTTLAIDVAPQRDSMIIYQSNCKTLHEQ